MCFCPEGWSSWSQDACLEARVSDMTAWTLPQWWGCIKWWQQPQSNHSCYSILERKGGGGEIPGIQLGKQRPAGLQVALCERLFRANPPPNSPAVKLDCKQSRLRERFTLTSALYCRSSPGLRFRGHPPSSGQNWACCFPEETRSTPPRAAAERVAATWTSCCQNKSTRRETTANICGVYRRRRFSYSSQTASTHPLVSSHSLLLL